MKSNGGRRSCRSVFVREGYESRVSASLLAATLALSCRRHTPGAPAGLCRGRGFQRSHPLLAFGVHALGAQSPSVGPWAARWLSADERSEKILTRHIRPSRPVM